MSNPLLEAKGLPPFSQIRPEHVKPAVEQVIKDYRNVVEKVVANNHYSWENFISPLTEVSDRLSKIWSPVSHLNSVMNSEPLREAYESCLPLLSELSTYLGQHAGLYKAYQSLKESEEFATYSKAQQKTITDSLRDFELSGIGLAADKQKRFGEISQRLSELASKFSNQVLDATHAWFKHVTDKEDLAGLPESALEAAAHVAKTKELDGWVLTLDIPSYLPVMTYADNRALREEMYRAYSTRASELGPNAGEFDNTEVIKETLALRYEKAQLLGFANYAELSLATKMAQSTEQVMGFLHDLAKRSKPQGEQELAELKAFTREHYGVEELEAWDNAYYSEKLKQHKYAISDEQLRPYFPEDKVLSGLFETVHRLYGIDVRPGDGVELWHPEVRYFEIYDQQNHLRASFYLDLYAREHKRGGAWMDECQVRRKLPDGSIQLPVAYLTCNFNRPVGDKPALFTHDEVLTLFHEFGHGLHHMLTQIDVADVSGINGVAWDAVELPSQFMENWCWQSEALSFISGHYQSAEPLPEDMLEKLLAARNYHSAMAMLRQLEFSLFDFTLHAQDPATLGVQQVLNDVRDEVAVLDVPEFNRFQNGFGHIFAGGYAAGYYSYKWAEVLSSDAFSMFEENGIFDAQTGQSFLHNILEKGGSEEPMQLFKNFRGREPKVDALLRHSGIQA
ncbi:oligopeptidase A [Celerinatantimonas diazotrophica]|uniref:oligopeptidase A n=1 Tax=Celerinatantimonas diazotrophica TaxID=412034 RepID=A0A4R1J8S5_9GAMM|nr:oligopeptidase A [Celerinatantimonas diazotrophica]TCK46744.1 oligopeptidase A [Celerinatantimonas diazotrophica]CAG9295447.1 Oligopeptidase A [Celerinatantimonas diazotrophica]